MTERQPTTRDLTGDVHTDQETYDGTADAPSDEPLGRDRSGADRRHAGAPGGTEPLLPDNQTEGFTLRWQELQTEFVDRPRESVEQADALVADLMRRLAAGFADERERLEAQWDRGDDVSTEELRVALTRYRSFFDRLLSA
jgi:hypothetical protein